MNRACYGTYFETLGLYRCLYDGSMIKLSYSDVVSKPPSICPACNRKIDASIQRGNPDIRTVVTVQQEVWIEQFGWVPLNIRKELTIHQDEEEELYIGSGDESVTDEE